MPLLPPAAVLVAAVASAAATSIDLNDNTRRAGQLAGGTITVHLVAGMGSWRPNGAEGRAIEVRAFSEEGGAPSIPAPLIRAVQGTDVMATVRNTLDEELRVFGLCGPPGPCQPIPVPAGQTREVRFSLKAPGTYYYWATTRGQALTSRPLADSQLGGAIVVDPRESSTADRVMVVSMYQEATGPGPCGLANTTPDSVFVINGASWPHTARLHYTTGESVRWRVINLSCDQHAMHLHGFHFVVEAAGDGTTDHPFAAAEQRTEVTENLPPGRTFAMTWTPTRPGNWLFHCHMVVHMAPAADAAHPMHDVGSDAGMAGLVVGIEVTGNPLATSEPSAPTRRVSMLLREEQNRYGSAPGFRVDIEGAPRLDPGPVPGPVLVLHRGEPTEITVVNQMRQPTAVHWHGLEIESYYDGVPGFGGDASRIAPPIGPGESFVARITPPRSGTFIYHTHWHDEAQLAGGLYGPILVLEPGEHFDPDTDHVVVIGLNGQVKRDAREPFALNGLASPAPIKLRAGVPNRLRLINITPANVALVASLVDNGDPVEWKPVAKDGATLPPDASKTRRARQPVAVGETYDFEVPARGPGNLWLEVRRGNGEWVLQAPVQIR